MSEKIRTWSKALRPAGIVLATGFLALLFFLSLRGDYKLNRVVRECHLRMIQIEVLSATMSLDFRIIFHDDRCVVDIQAGGEGKWDRYGESEYGGRIRNVSGETELVFSRGTLSDFRLAGRKPSLQKYATIEFAHPGSSRRPGFIFFASGMWHVRK